MLLGEKFSRRHQCDLITTADRASRRRRCDHRLATADITLHQTNHRLSLLQIALDILEAALLSSSQCVRQGFFKAS